MEWLKPPTLALDSDTVSFIIKDRFGVKPRFRAEEGLEMKLVEWRSGGLFRACATFITVGTLFACSSATCCL
jgi:hypothetical protein